jgi:hypothetical protein
MTDLMAGLVSTVHSHKIWPYQSIQLIAQINFGSLDQLDEQLNSGRGERGLALV